MGQHMKRTHLVAYISLNSVCCPRQAAKDLVTGAQPIRNVNERENRARVKRQERKKPEEYPPLTLHLYRLENRERICWRFLYPESTPCAHMSLITKHGPFSQAGHPG